MESKKIVFSALLFIAIGLVVGFNSTPPEIQAKRGKVLTTSESKLNFKNLNIINASFSPSQTVVDSTDVISGEICILRNDAPTGKTVPFQPRRFPKWFEFGCEDAGDFIEYKLVAGGRKAIITRIPPRPPRE
ncbi:MAG: hypothetical protein KFF73_18975 [Cyclobacteriaceae bacterium]|nr:hypothetical protein [Cyclobacteriaceae bacterium]